LRGPGQCESGGDSLASNEGMTIERTDDVLIVRSHRHGINWLGAAFAAFSMCWTLFWNRHDAQGEATYWSGLGTGIIFILIGVFLMLPRSVLTIFDLRSERVRRSVSVFGWTYRDQTCPFADIAGVGIIAGSQSDNRDPTPVLRLKAGPTLSLDTVRTYRLDVGKSESMRSIETICAATRLPRLDT
jgi:hypothetical protein